jgi:hypothetical protein
VRFSFTFYTHWTLGSSIILHSLGHHSQIAI